MDTEKCKALLCILKLGNFSTAAEAMGYTPSGISRLVSSVEQELGFPLLVRSHRGVMPTAECRQLLPTMQGLVQMGEQLTCLSAGIRGVEAGEVTIGTSYRSYYPWLIELISAFSKSHPGIKIHILEGNSSDLTLAMEQNRVDVCIISRREGDFSWVPLQQNPLVAWLPPDHPCANADAFPIAAFSTEPYINPYPDQDTDNARMFRQYGITPNVRFSTTDNYATYRMVEAGLGVSLNNSLNSGEWNGAVAIKPLFPPQVVEIGLAIPSPKLLSPAAKRFVSFAKSQTLES